MKKELKLPKFKSEDAERDYWSKLNLTKYIELADLEPVSFPNLKPTSQPISIRLPQHLLQRVRERANALDIPYQALIKIYLADRVREDTAKDYKARSKVIGVVEPYENVKIATLAKLEAFFSAFPIKKEKRYIRSTLRKSMAKIFLDTNTYYKGRKAS